MSVINWPILYIPDPTKGRPLFSGQIFVGEPDTDPQVAINQKQLNVIEENGTVVSVSQPFPLSAGGVPVYNGNPVRLDVDGNYSIKILNKLGAQVYYVENVYEGQPVTEASLPDLLINDLSQSYEFPTVAVYKAFTTAFPVGKVIDITELSAGEGRGASYTVIAGIGSNNNDNILASDQVDQSISRTDSQLQVKSIADYASFAANVAGPISIIGHTPGTVVSDTSSLGTLNKNSTYRITVDITTTASGRVKILFDDTDAIYGDQPNGLFFSDATILADASENNRILSTTVYTFTLLTFSTAFSTLKIETDLLWGGTIASVLVEEVTPVETGVGIIATDGDTLNNSVGMKTTKSNRGDVALGDRGTMALAFDDLASPTPAFSTAMGSRSLMNSQLGDHNSSFGAFSLQSNEGSNNDAFGYSALKLCVKGQENAAFGYKAATALTTGYRSCFFGFFSGVGIQTGAENSEFGWRPIIASVDKSFHTSFGSRAGTGITGNSNTFMGASAGISVSGQSDLDISLAVGIGAECKPWGDGAVTLGYQSKAGTEGLFAPGAIAIGHGANSTTSRAISMGFNASGQSTGAIAIGDVALAGADGAISIGDGNVANASRAVSVGAASSAALQSTTVGSLCTPTGSNVTAAGFRAGNNFSGDDNTFLGHTAGNQATETFTNCTLLGKNTIVTASNQVQLGDLNTTTYAFGAVQDRSDARDKLDIKDLTDAHIAFFMAVEWKQYRMNYREAYRVVDDKGNESYLDSDESKAGERYHIGAIAQQVEEAMKANDIDFAGLQHHSVSGGQDVYTIGYQEFIGIQGLIIQRQQARFISIEKRLAKGGL